MGLGKSVSDSLYDEFVMKVDLGAKGLEYLWAVAKKHVDSECDMVNRVWDAESAETYFSMVFSVCMLLLQLTDGGE